MRSLVSIAMVLLTIAVFPGCSENPGTMSQSAIEEKLKEVLELKAVSLTENPAGGYKGKGTSQTGMEYDLTITQDPEEKILRYQAESKDAPVRRGFIKHY